MPGLCKLLAGSFLLVALMAPSVRAYQNPPTPSDKSETYLKNLQDRAAAGDPKAQVDLGKKYVEGSGGVPKDYTQALLWFRKAADQGFANGQYDVGFLYGNGWGVKQDLAERT